MNRKNLALGGFILVKFLLQFTLISSEYELHRDEYLHLDQGRHLAWGYLSVPPVTSWISWLIYQLGNGIFWIKFFPALFGALTLLVVWKAVERLKGGWFALILGAVAVLFSVLLRLNTLYQPNSLDVLLWTTLYYALLSYLDSEKPRWLYLAALAFALGFLNKYNIAFLVVGLLPALLLSPHRTLFTSRHLYLAAGVALVGIAPNLVWQYTHGFPVVHHMNELAATQLVNVNRLDFLKEQLLYFLGSFHVVLAGLASYFLYAPFRKYQVFFWAFLFTLLAFIYLRAKGYYAIGLYPIQLAFGSVYLECLLARDWRRYLRPVAVGVPILFLALVYTLIFPVVSPAEIRRNEARYKKIGMLRWEDGKDHPLPQDFADMQGWKELARKVDYASSLVQGKGRTLILCDNYGQTGAINYYSKNKALRAVSLNADYIDWFELDTPIENIILVQEADDDDKARNRERALFERIILIGAIENPYAREQGTRIYLLENAQVDINKILAQDINERKNGMD